MLAYQAVLLTPSESSGSPRAKLGGPPQLPSCQQVASGRHHIPLFVFKRLSTLSVSESRKSFPCHRSEKISAKSKYCHTSKTSENNPCVCHTSETPRGVPHLLTSLPLAALPAPPATLFHPWHASVSASTSSETFSGAKRSPAPSAFRRIPPFRCQGMTSTVGSKSAPATAK